MTYFKVRVAEMLVSLFLMPSLAMKDARTLANRLHRDISVGNIILVRDHPGSVRKGYLIDWEVSSEVDDSGTSLDAGRMVCCINYLQCDSQVCRIGNVALHVETRTFCGWINRKPHSAG